MKKVLCHTLWFLLIFSCAEKSEQPVEPTKAYSEILSFIQLKKKEIKERYDRSDALARREIIAEIRHFMYDQLTEEIFPSWKGTAWDFNGVSEVPREGYIACGYFVTTTLRDLGFNVPRVKWAQAASEKMIVAVSRDVKRFSNKPIEDVEQWLLENEDAIYIVGLDNHVGFVYKKGNTLWSVHSSPFNSANGGVVIEPVTADSPLKFSAYRVFGKIFSDEMILAWINHVEYS